MNWPVGITPLLALMIFAVASMTLCSASAKAQHSDNLAVIPTLSSGTLDLRTFDIVEF